MRVRMFIGARGAPWQRAGEGMVKQVEAVELLSLRSLTARTLK